MADELGRYSIRAPSAGQYGVLARGLGFRPGLASPVVVSDTGHVEVHLDLFRIAVQLEDITVEAIIGERYLEMAGFYRREEMGLGHFMDRKAVEERLPVSQRATELLRGIPGVQILPGQFAGDEQTLRLSGISSVQNCGEPRMFVDGYLISGPIDEFVNPQDVEGIEVFRRPAEVPMQYGGAQAACGVVLFWTRRRQE